MAIENELSDKYDRSIDDVSLDPISEIKNLRLKKINEAIISNININSFSNKSKQLKELGMKHIDALIITEIKLDSLFPTSELLSKGFSEPFRLG